MRETAGWPASLLTVFWWRGGSPPSPWPAWVFQNHALGLLHLRSSSYAKKQVSDTGYFWVREGGVWEWFWLELMGQGPGHGEWMGSFMLPPLGLLRASLGAGEGQGRRPLTSSRSVNSPQGTEAVIVARAQCLPGWGRNNLQAVWAEILVALPRWRQVTNNKTRGSFCRSKLGEKSHFWRRSNSYFSNHY